MEMRGEVIFKGVLRHALPTMTWIELRMSNNDEGGA